MLFEVEIFENNGENHVQSHLDSLKKTCKPLWLKVIGYLRNRVQESQNHVMPFWKPLGDGIFEIRHRVSRQISRIYGCYNGKGKIMLLCGGSKKGQKADIKKAVELKIKLKGEKNEKN